MESEHVTTYLPLSSLKLLVELFLHVNREGLQVESMYMDWSKKTGKVTEITAVTSCGTVYTRNSAGQMSKKLKNGEMFQGIALNIS